MALVAICEAYAAAAAGLTHDGLLTTSTPQPVLYEYYTGPELGYQILQTATTSKGTTLTVTTNLAPWAPIMVG